MSARFEQRLEGELEQFIRDGVYKRLNYLDSPQDARVRMEGRGEVIILSSNNYLGLCNQPEVIAAGKAALDRYGAGTASVRFICGTYTVHRTLEAACARLVGTGASLSFVSRVDRQGASARALPRGAACARWSARARAPREPASAPLWPSSSRACRAGAAG